MDGSSEPLKDRRGPAKLDDVPLLWRSCKQCGGVSVPLRLLDEPGVGPSTLDTSSAACPHCETQRRRLEPPGGQPAVWYDTLLQDWVVRLPVPRMPMDAILPLEFGWYDTPWSEVYRVAADLAFAEEAFALREIEAAEEAEDF